ncbi:hypothetical protein CDAR_564511 [Caerostris darwini]|uniref:Uncharacterized protein n=1 Tax=Caerostris darwini TaxID=1538125 RepID=A0AAV4TJR8_9ARAC|nr:hypothetical protein CDAR_564511 [Caerostris darwini]
MGKKETPDTACHQNGTRVKSNGHRANPDSQNIRAHTSNTPKSGNFFARKLRKDSEKRVTLKKEPKKISDAKEFLVSGSSSGGGFFSWVGCRNSEFVGNFILFHNYTVEAVEMIAVDEDDIFFPRLPFGFFVVVVYLVFGEWILKGWIFFVGGMQVGLDHRFPEISGL